MNTDSIIVIRIKVRNLYFVLVDESVKADDGLVLCGSETGLTGAVAAGADNLGPLVQVDHDVEDDKEGEDGEDGNDDGDDTAGVGDDKVRSVHGERVGPVSRGHVRDLDRDPGHVQER